MSEHQITVERPWKGLPTKQLINIETGQTEVFIKEFPFPDIKVAESGADNKWKITDENELLRRYNNKNSKNLTGKELQKEFNNSGVKQFNNDRADVINKNSLENTKTFLATKQNPVPGTIDPKTGIKVGQTAPQPGISTTSPGPEFGTNLSKGIGEKDKTRNNFSKTLKYPINLKSESQDVIKFNMVKYEPKKFQAERLEFEKRKENRQIIGTVTLPIPAGISDMNACNWGGGEINAFDAGLQNLAMASIPGGGAGFSDTFKKLAEGIQGSNAEVKAAITAAFTANATGTNQVLQRTSGLVINQNLELLFGGPTLRPFSFTFKMSAREEGEAKEIRSIIRFFKQGMSPIRTQSSLFLKTPHTFQIQYRHQNEEHKFLNKFKECALTSFSVNYTPEGQYATYTDGAMVSYEMQMQFTELEPIFNDEYPEDNDASIGF